LIDQENKISFLYDKNISNKKEFDKLKLENQNLIDELNIASNKLKLLDTYRNENEKLRNYIDQTTNENQNIKNNCNKLEIANKEITINFTLSQTENKTLNQK